MPGTSRRIDAEADLAVLTERLTRRFGPHVSREEIEETIALCAAPFREARIVDFVPVLTERSCVTRLRAVADAAGGPSIPAPDRLPAQRP